MKKHIITGVLLLSAAIGLGQVQRLQDGKLEEFHCRLPDIKCDGCRASVSDELLKESGIRAVRFEGEDRKELVVSHTSKRTTASLQTSLTRIGYSVESLNGDPSKAVSHQSCVCPTERAKAGYLKP
jgi:hypothetical protein